MRTVTALNRSLKYSFAQFSTAFWNRTDTNMSESSVSAVVLDDLGNIKKKIQEFIPKLKTGLHKGDCGRVAIIGGSFEYTGAPFFAAISALKLGCDLVHVFCAKDAGPIIKSYSPELMVHPCLDLSDAIKMIEPWLEKFHVLVIGPGMGRSPVVLKNVTNVINFCKKGLRPAPPLIIDADGLHLISEDPNVLKNYPGVIFLTPNNPEYTRLCNKTGENTPAKVAAFYNAILLQKGPVDVITNGIHSSRMSFTDLVLSCTMVGSKRRCGGQGDVLAGCLGTFVAWANIHARNELKFDFFKLDSQEAGFDRMECLRDTFTIFSLAAFSACVITKACSRLAYEAKGRGMTTTDVISFIDKAFRSQFDS